LQLHRSREDSQVATGTAFYKLVEFYDTVEAVRRATDNSATTLLADFACCGGALLASLSQRARSRLGR
jgi:hypothetical protein